jgi:hypothetical protein
MACPFSHKYVTIYKINIPGLVEYYNRNMVIVVVSQLTAEKKYLPEVVESLHAVVVANCSSEPGVLEA